MATQVGERVERNPLIHGQTRKGIGAPGLPLRCKVRERGEGRVQAFIVKHDTWQRLGADGEKRCDPEAETSKHEQGVLHEE
eukprot:460768-Pleurochrysis_carterae.AAC.2